MTTSSPDRFAEFFPRYDQSDYSDIPNPKNPVESLSEELPHVPVPESINRGRDIMLSTAIQHLLDHTGEVLYPPREDHEKRGRMHPTERLAIILGLMLHLAKRGELPRNCIQYLRKTFDLTHRQSEALLNDARALIQQRIRWALKEHTGQVADMLTFESQAEEWLMVLRGAEQEKDLKLMAKCLEELGRLKDKIDARDGKSKSNVRGNRKPEAKNPRGRPPKVNVVKFASPSDGVDPRHLSVEELENLAKGLPPSQG